MVLIFKKRGIHLNTGIVICISNVRISRKPECMKIPDTEFFQFIAEKMAGERKALAVE